MTWRCSRPALGALALLIGSSCMPGRLPKVRHAQGGGGAAACGAQAYPSSRGICVPEGWYCSPALYGAGAADGCDCDCGAPDPDCALSQVTTWCYGTGMARNVRHCAVCGLAPGQRALEAALP